MAQMTKEDRDLLLKDLCARLPYNVKIQSWYGAIITSDLNTFPFSMEEMDKEDMWDQLSGFKPYLRPMSSMTKEERKEFNNILEFQYYSDDSQMCESTDWLNKNHFDYRGLIEKGLALEAPEGMYKIEKQSEQ